MPLGQWFPAFFFVISVPPRNFYDVLAPLKELTIKNIYRYVFSCNLLQEKLKGSIKEIKCLAARLDTRTPWIAISHPWLENPAFGEKAEDILNDLSDRIASLQTSKRTKKLSMLIPPMAPKKRKYYCFQGDQTPPNIYCFPGASLSSLYAILKNMSRLDVTFTFSEVKELEAAWRTLLEAMSWID